MDSAARRKRQNRLNQRAYREPRTCLEERQTSKININVGRREAQKEQNVQQQSINVSNTREYQPHITPNNPSTQISELSVVPAHSRPDGSLTRPPLIPYFSPTSPFLIPGPITFPLTADHLITLIQYNVLRAIFTNIWILSLGENLPTECGNVLALPKFAVPSTIPPSFEPTPLQKCTPHDFWIDTVPLGRARDNFILMTGSYDHDDLCSDMVGGLYEGYNDCKSELKSPVWAAMEEGKTFVER